MWTHTKREEVLDESFDRRYQSRIGNVRTWERVERKQFFVVGREDVYLTEDSLESRALAGVA